MKEGCEPKNISLGSHHGGSHLDHQHHVTLQEGTTAPTLSPPAEKSKSPTTHPHHILQGHHWECADQLHHCLVRELQCCWLQDPPADSEHSCKDHRCPSPIHPGHFPCTMLQQNQQHREGPHPPLPQSLQVQVQVELYCHSATCGDIQWNEMSCLTGPRCYINTDIQQWSKTL